MIVGEYETKVTDNFRVAVPVKFRKEIGNELIVMQGYEECLVLTDASRFAALTKDISNGSFMSGAVRDTTRFLVGSANEIKVDKQGRFTLPQSLKEYSSIKDEVIFLGLINWIEIWNKQNWLEKKKQVKKDSNKLAEEINIALTNDKP